MPLTVEARGPVLLITMDRPEVHNAIDPEMHHALVDAWTRLRDDEALRVGVLLGAGGRAFSAGVDLKRMGEFYRNAGAVGSGAVGDSAPGIGGLTRNFEVGKPTIAAIDGHCLGGGLELALACDLRYATPQSSFGLPEVAWAILPGQGGTQRLPRAVPLGIALEMILTARPITAERAFQVGLVNGLLPKEELLASTIATAERIASLPPRAVRHAREAVLRGLDLPLVEGIRVEQALAAPLRDSEENRAARARFGR